MRQRSMTRIPSALIAAALVATSCATAASREAASGDADSLAPATSPSSKQWTFTPRNEQFDAVLADDGILMSIVQRSAINITSRRGPERHERWLYWVDMALMEFYAQRTGSSGPVSPDTLSLDQDPTVRALGRVKELIWWDLTRESPDYALDLKVTKQEEADVERVKEAMELLDDAYFAIDEERSP